MSDYAVAIGSRIRITKNGRTGVVRKINTNTNAVQVKLDDAKAASWYWVADIELLSEG